MNTTFLRTLPILLPLLAIGCSPSGAPSSDALTAADDSAKTDSAATPMLVSASALPPKPGPGNTGPTNRTILRNIGGLTITKTGTILENVKITGTVHVKANNVTIRNFVVNANGGHWGIRANYGFTGGKFQNGEIYGMGTAGVQGDGFTATALNIHDSGGDGVKIQGTGGATLVERCWIHHLGTHVDAHADGNQSLNGSNITFRHNNFDLPGNPPPSGYKVNAAFMLQTTNGPISNFLIDSNWLNGGGWTIFAPPGQDIRVINNRFGHDYRFGLISAQDRPNVTWSGNVWEDSGALIKFGSDGKVIDPTRPE